MDENGNLTQAGAANVKQWFWDTFDTLIQTAYIVGRTPAAIAQWCPGTGTAEQIEKVAKTGNSN